MIIKVQLLLLYFPVAAAVTIVDVIVFTVNIDPANRLTMLASRPITIWFQIISAGAVHKLRHATFGQFDPLPPLSHFVTHLETP